MSRTHLNRRRVLLAGASISVALAGCTDGTTTDESPAGDDGGEMDGEDDALDVEDDGASEDEELDQEREGGLGRDEETTGAEDGESSVATVAVGPEGDPAFDPETVEIVPERGVRWEWESDGHTVTPESVPEGADWEGEPEEHDAGHDYEHTFETPGTYEYYCEPHRDNGMTGAVVVEEGDGTSADAGGEPSGEETDEENGDGVTDETSGDEESGR